MEHESGRELSSGGENGAPAAPSPGFAEPAALVASLSPLRSQEPPAPYKGI